MRILNRTPSVKFRIFRALQRALRLMTNKMDLVPGPVQYNEDGMATVNAADFLRDPLFVESYRLGEATGSWKDIRWRCYVCCWAASHAYNLEGDFVECGVNRGGYSRAILNYVDLRAVHKTLYLLDTFRGLVDESLTDEERLLGRTAGGYDECYADVVRTFAGQPVEIIRGTIPGTLPLVTSPKIAYLSIDMNCVQPEIAAIEYFWPRLVRGGVVVHDDYAMPAFVQQKRALDAFAERNRVRVLTLPTGQGLLFKP
jgi:O-methyltransferase